MIKSFRGKYQFLSNFYYCLIRCHDHDWTTAEHLFQGIKTLDPDVREKIRQTQYPYDARKMGRRVKLRPGWEKLKLKFMKNVLRMKFTQNPKLHKRLVATGNKELLEGNVWHDNFWGDCICSKCKNMSGKNWLGKLLMEIRKELRK